MAGAFTELPFSTESGSGAIVVPFISSTVAFFLPTFVEPGDAETVNTAGIAEDELLDLWKSVTDPGYHRPILENQAWQRTRQEGSRRSSQ